jgi:hypothetical protein
VIQNHHEAAKQSADLGDNHETGLDKQNLESVKKSN